MKKVLFICLIALAVLACPLSGHAATVHVPHRVVLAAPQSTGGVTCPAGVTHCVQLSWTPGAGGSPPTSYNVYQSSTNNGCATVSASTCTKIGSSTTTGFLVSPVTASTTYFWVVTAVNGAGESLPSNQATLTINPDPPPPPSGLGAQQSSVTNPPIPPVSGTGGLINPFCDKNGNWVGPAITGGVAHAPRACYATDIADTPTPGKIINGGTTLASLQAAINGANCGDIVEGTLGGSGTGPLVLPNKPCDDQHYIWIRTNGYEDPNFPAEGTLMTPCWSGVASMPGRPAYPCPSPKVLTFKIQAPNAGNAVSVQPGANHYRITGYELTRVTTGGAAIYNLIDVSSSTAQASKLIIERNWIHGVPGVFPVTSQSQDTSTTRGIWLGQANHIGIDHNYFSDFYDTSAMSANGNTDAQCIGGGAGTIPNSGWGVYNIGANHCEASGEGILLGGSSGPALTPAGCTVMVNCNLDTVTDGVVYNNYFFKPPYWNCNLTTPCGTGWPVVKNGFEMKTGAYWYFYGNVVEGCWYNAQVCGTWNTAPLNQGSASGTPMCPTCVVSDFAYVDNYSYNVAYGIAFYAFIQAGCPACASQGANNVAFVNNLIGDDMNLGNLGGSSGDEMELLAVADPQSLGRLQVNNVVIQHNTFVKGLRSAFWLGGGTGQMHNWKFQDNIFHYGQYGVGPAGNTCDAGISWGQDNFFGLLNQCVTGWTADHNAVFAWGDGTLGANWPTDGKGAGNFFFSGTANVGFTNYGTGDSNFNPSNYQLLSTSPLHNAASDGTDIGANIPAVLKAIAGVRQ